VSSAIVLVLSVALYVGTRFLGLRIVGGQIYLGGSGEPTGAHATVDAVGGLQNSHVWMKKGERLVLEPEGRIHLAADQAYNFARAAKPLILRYLPSRPWPLAMKRRYPMPRLDETTIFYRGMGGSGRESYESDLLADCKLRQDVNWGTLLATTLPNAVSSAQDPPCNGCPEPSFAAPENLISRGTARAVAVGVACCATKKGTSKVTHAKIDVAAKTRPLVAGFTGIRPPDLSLVLLPPASSPTYADQFQRRPTARTRWAPIDGSWCAACGLYSGSFLPEPAARESLQHSSHLFN
jgi:hypothetical protein